MNVRVSRVSGVEAAPVMEETILFSPLTNTFCLLNRTAAFLWTRLETPRTAEELAAELCSNFDGVSEPDALRDIEQALGQLISLKMAEVEHH